ncbi:hypothetical protein RFM42_31970 [Mesorhizobium sp. VK25D]|uniref:Uncharacterized protein n=1 Tax=Mesorhizobium vachelliae TaxID=3072309 RepID=A0ABU5AEC6_9HYPH|nr:hypothetical protein [Mesorhizobium sp. VK25A]MDX8535627.1 hypothetical protein [Mesorhizobium sp. VK25D]
MVLSETFASRHFANTLNIVSAILGRKPLHAGIALDSDVIVSRRSNSRTRMNAAS